MPTVPVPVIDLNEKLTHFADHWAPRTIAEYNGHDVMVVKVQGEFRWHSHADTDDFFLVLRGRLEIDLPDGTVTLGPGSSTSCRAASSIVRAPSTARCTCCSSSRRARPTAAT